MLSWLSLTTNVLSIVGGIIFCVGSFCYLTEISFYNLNEGATLFTIGSFLYMVNDIIVLCVENGRNPTVSDRGVKGRSSRSLIKDDVNDPGNQISLELSEKNTISINNPINDLPSPSTASAIEAKIVVNDLPSPSTVSVIEADTLINIASFTGSLLFTVGSICFYPSVNELLGLYFFIVGSVIVAVVETKRVFDANKKVLTKTDRGGKSFSMAKLGESNVPETSSISSTNQEQIKNNLRAGGMRTDMFLFLLHIALTIGGWTYLLGCFFFLFATSASSFLGLAAGYTFIVGGIFFGVSALLQMMILYLSF